MTTPSSTSQAETIPTSFLVSPSMTMTGRLESLLCSVGDALHNERGEYAAKHLLLDKLYFFII